LIVLGVVFTVAAASASVVDVPLRGGVGDRTWTPVADVRPAYRLGAGDATLDLSRIAADDVTTEVSVGAGNLQVFVPADATVEVDAHTGLGDLRVFGRHSNGFDLDREVTARGSELGPHVKVKIRVGVGSVEVVRDERVGSGS
jgi:hypothetical protein